MQAFSAVTKLYCAAASDTYAVSLERCPALSAAPMKRPCLAAAARRVDEFEDEDAVATPLNAVTDAEARATTSGDLTIAFFFGTN